MEFDPPLLEARLERRYKRFLADVALPDGEIVTAHCVNPGAMADIAVPGARIWLSHVTSPKAKLKYRWEIEETEDGLVGVNTTLANRLAEEALAAGRIVDRARYPVLRREVKYGAGSRIDFLLQTGDGQHCFLEVKNVHWRRKGAAAFPDSVTKRGARHLAELAQRAAQGDRAILVYVVQRDDCAALKVAQDIDPDYAAAFEAARRAGVECRAFGCTVSPKGIMLDQELPVEEG